MNTSRSTRAGKLISDSHSSVFPDHRTRGDGSATDYLVADIRQIVPDPTGLLRHASSQSFNRILDVNKSSAGLNVGGYPGRFSPITLATKEETMEPGSVIPLMRSEPAMGRHAGAEHRASLPISNLLFVQSQHRTC